MKEWEAVQLSEIPARDGWVPVRDHFGIGAFGINAWVGREAGDIVIGEHRERWTGHEELYVVLAGHATFTLDGDEIDAPAGTIVHVGEPDVLRKAVAKAAETTVVAVGGKPGEAFAVSQWEGGWQFNQRAMALYREQRYAEAADILREGLIEHPDHAGFQYNLACFESMAGAPIERVVEPLRRAIADYPDFKQMAEDDSDFDPVRESPEFQSAIAGKPEPRSAGA